MRCCRHYLCAVFAFVIAIAITGCRDSDNTGDINDGHMEMQSRFIPATVETSDAAQAKIKDFLIDFYSVYSLGEICSADGTYICYYTGGILDERPLVLYYRPLRGSSTFGSNAYGFTLYGRAGQPFKDVVFQDGFVVAQGFRLFDINNDGIPAIFILWSMPDTCGMFYEIYMYIDGRFKSVGDISGRGTQLFYDYSGQLVMLVDCDLNEWYAYYFLVLTNGEIVHEEILSVSRRDADFSLWAEHHSSAEFANAPTIFGTILPLTPIKELTALQEEIFIYLQQSVPPVDVESNPPIDYRDYIGLWFGYAIAIMERLEIIDIIGSEVTFNHWGRVLTKPINDNQFSYTLERIDASGDPMRMKYVFEFFEEYILLSSYMHRQEYDEIGFQWRLMSEEVWSHFDDWVDWGDCFDDWH